MNDESSKTNSGTPLVINHQLIESLAGSYSIDEVDPGFSSGYPRLTMLQAFNHS